jgi:dynein heavy chain 1
LYLQNHYYFDHFLFILIFSLFIFLQINVLIVELKSEALKERHWKNLMRRLHVSWVLTDLTLGQVWDVDLQRNEAVVKDAILVAQGEMALEEFLKQVSFWNCNLEICIVQASCTFIDSLSYIFCFVGSRHVAML